MKDAYYFPHDSNAAHDPKCAALINDFGLEGYGFYWLLMEIMHQQADGKIEKFPKLFDGLAFEFKTTAENVSKLIEAMLQSYNLLKQDEKFIWSERVLRNFENRKLKYEVKSNSGRIGGINSGISRRESKQNEAPLKANEQKERKGKERKVNIKTETKASTPLFKPLALKTNGPTPEQLMALWNEKAHPNLPRVEMMTDKRRSHIGARLKDHPEKEFWDKLIERVNNSPLLRGENDRSWKCNFDWILNVNNMAKILEGNYDPVKRYS